MATNRYPMNTPRSMVGQHRGGSIYDKYMDKGYQKQARMQQFYQGLGPLGMSLMAAGMKGVSPEKRGQLMTQGMQALNQSMDPNLGMQMQMAGMQGKALEDEAALRPLQKQAAELGIEQSQMTIDTAKADARRKAAIMGQFGMTPQPGGGAGGASADVFSPPVGADPKLQGGTTPGQTSPLMAAFNTLLPEQQGIARALLAEDMDKGLTYIGQQAAKSRKTIAQDPYGRGGVGQIDQYGAISAYQGPQEIKTRKLSQAGGMIQDQQLDRKTGKWEDYGAPYSRRGKGLSVVSDGKGGFTITQGDVSPDALGKSAQGKLEGKMLDLSNEMQQTSAAFQNFNPDWQRWGAQMTQAWNTIRDKGADIIPSLALSPEETASLTAYTDYQAGIAELFATTLNRLSGVAVNPAEYKRAESFQPNKNDSPIELQSKMRRLMKFQKDAMAKYHYIRKNGFSVGDVDMNMMPGIIRRRGNALDKKYKAQGLTGDDLRGAVLQDLGAEFGLVAP